MTKSDSAIPGHIAIIADGNRRWARKQGLSAIFGHKAAVDATFEPLIARATKLGVKYLTFWVFSTENWKRSPKEIELLLELFRSGFEKKIQLFHEHKVRLQIIGDITRFPDDVQAAAKKAVAETADYSTITVVFAMNYGGRDELVRAARKCAGDPEVDLRRLDQVDIAKHLDTAQIPDPDLIIRTGGEQRLSGFMLWQCEYAELYFSDVLFPDFGAEELSRAVEEFSRRQRRFGGG